MSGSASTTLFTAVFRVDPIQHPREKIIRKVCMVFVKLAERFHLRVGKCAQDGAIVCCFADDDSRAVLFSSAMLEVVQTIGLVDSGGMPMVSVQLTWHHPGTGSQHRGYRKRRHFIELFTHAWRKLLTRLFVEKEALIQPDDQILVAARDGSEHVPGGGSGLYAVGRIAKGSEQDLLILQKRKEKEEFLASEEVRKAVAPFNYDDEQKEKRKVSSLKDTEVDEEIRRKIAPFNYDEPIRLSKRMKGESEGDVRKAVAPFNYPD